MTTGTSDAPTPPSQGATQPAPPHDPSPSDNLTADGAGGPAPDIHPAPTAQVARGRRSAGDRRAGRKTSETPAGRSPRGASEQLSMPAIMPEREAFKIGDAATLVGVRAHVLRFWEQEFPRLTPRKGATGHRYYSRDEVEQLRRLRTLLYDRGYTIAGARALFDEGAEAVDAVLAGRPVEAAAAVEAASARVAAVTAELAAEVEKLKATEKALARAREEAAFWRAETRRAELALVRLRAAVLEEAGRLAAGVEASPRAN